MSGIDEFFDKADSLLDKVTPRGTIGFTLIRNNWHFALKGMSSVCGQDVSDLEISLTIPSGYVLFCSHCLNSARDTIEQSR
jgi:hypothetical protein